jgi:hypothetical protein
MGRALLILLRIICYLTLALFAVAIVSMIFLSDRAVCPRLDAGRVQCITPFYEGLANFAFGVLMSRIIGLPALLAFGGVVFLIIDLLRWRRCRKARQAGQIPA